MAFVEYPSSLLNKTWQKAKSALAGKTGIGDKLDELETAHGHITASAFLASSLLQTKQEIDDWKKIVDPEIVKATKFQKLLVSFSQFATTKAADLKKQKTCPTKTRELVEKMSGTAKKLALDVGVAMEDVAKLIEKAQKSLPPDEPDDGDLPAQLKAAKTSSRKFVVALGKVPGLIITKSSITGAQRQLAKDLSGGGGKLIEGGVVFENAKYVFELDEKPPNGLARALKKAIAIQTKTNVKVMVRGGGVAIDDDADVDDPPMTTPPPSKPPQTTTPPTNTPPTKPPQSGTTTPPTGGKPTGTTPPTSTSTPSVDTSGLSDNQKKLLALAINHGAMDSAGANKLLQTAPPGSWLIRYSPNQKQCIISKKLPDGKLMHYFTNSEGKDLTLQELVSLNHLEVNLCIRPGQSTTGGTTPPTGAVDVPLQNAHAKVHQLLDLCKKSLGELGPPLTNEIRLIESHMQAALLLTDASTVTSQFETAKKEYLDIINRAKKTAPVGTAPVGTATVEQKQKIKAKLKKDIFFVKASNGKSTTPAKLAKSPSFAANVAKHHGITVSEAQEILNALLDELLNETQSLLPPGFTKPHGDKNTINPNVPEQSRPKLTLEEAQAVLTYSTNAYQEINPPLWSGKIPPPPHDKTHKFLQDAFAKTKPFDTPVKVTRGMNFPPGSVTEGFIKSFRDAAGTDNLVPLTGYISTGTAGTPSDFKGNIEFVILAKQALDLQPYSEFPNEKELLLNHNTPVKVHSCVESGGKWTVTVEQMLPITS